MSKPPSGKKPSHRPPTKGKAPFKGKAPHGKAGQAASGAKKSARPGKDQRAASRGGPGKPKRPGAAPGSAVERPSFGGDRKPGFKPGHKPKHHERSERPERSADRSEARSRPEYSSDRKPGFKPGHKPKHHARAERPERTPERGETRARPEYTTDHKPGFKSKRFEKTERPAKSQHNPVRTVATRPGERHERGERTIDRALERIEKRERPERQDGRRDGSRNAHQETRSDIRPESRKRDGGHNAPFRQDHKSKRPERSERPERSGRPGRPERAEAAEEPRRSALRPGSSRQVIAGAIQLLQAIEQSGEPSDRVLHGWMKSNHRRFEAAERAAIVQIAEDVLRQRGRLDWWIARVGQGKIAPGMDLRVGAYRILANGAKIAGVIAALNLQESEVEPITALLQPLEGHTLEHPDMPAVARYNLPAWIEPRFRARYGADFDLEMAASLRPAPLDVRVNRLKTSREAALGVLGAAGLRAQATPLSPVGLRLGAQAYVNNSQAFADGLIEPQDEGSQLAALLVEPQGAKVVVDFCAGAGGKTLAIGAAMKNVGRLIAMDVSEKRLERARQRLRRAGVHNVECRPLEPKWLKRHAALADRVLIDAPCSGTGTWRRKPDARWRLKESDVLELTQRQAEILERAAKLVAPGGRLIYVTCSVLAEENETPVQAFLKAHADFSVLPIADIWNRSVGGVCPTAEDFLRLTPGRHGTDGFFVAVLEKQKA